MKTASRFELFDPYMPIEPFEVLSRRLARPADAIIKLDANENPYGPSPLALQALREIPFPHIYPDPENRELRQALAAFSGAPVGQILAGSGADELIDLLLRVVLEPGDVVVNCPPTFGMYDFDTRLNYGRVVNVPRRADFSLDTAAIEAAVRTWKPACLFVTAPNNPDGSMPECEQLEALLSLPVLVVIDEAYIEFVEGSGRLGAERSLVRQVAQRRNLVVLRTFSKWAGLAGLRVGWGVFPDWMMETLWKARQPYTVNRAAGAAAMASLQDEGLLAERVALLQAERRRLMEILVEVPYIEPRPSQTNFILCRLRGLPGKLLKTLLEERGILVRYYNHSALKDCVRISVGLPAHSDALALALKEIGSLDLASLAGWMGEEGDEPLKPAGEEAQTSSRRAHVRRVTRETRVEVDLELDGIGKAQVDTGLPFLDHMLTQVALHGLFDIHLKAEGDLQVDAHHTVEDCAIALGQAFHEALSDRRGIVRMGTAYCPMDESLVRVVVDLSGRPYAVVQADWGAPVIGGMPSTLFRHFLESLAIAARCNLHAVLLYGNDGHHQVEAMFKALGRALDEATRTDPRRGGAVPSSKGVL